MNRAEIVALGDSCLSIVFEEKIDPVLNATCIALAESLESQASLRDVVPSYNSVAVHFDPLKTDRVDLEVKLRRFLIEGNAVTRAEPPPLEMPVTYGGEWGPDLPGVAEFGHCSEEEVIRLHAGLVYRVYMLGFLPGFPYLASVDPRIAIPRLETPRARVVAGSVGIAGLQTGIYPFDTPGGWRIIGRTTMTIFDPSRPTPFLLKAGDRVKFVPV